MLLPLLLLPLFLLLLLLLLLLLAPPPWQPRSLRAPCADVRQGDTRRVGGYARRGTKIRGGAWRYAQGTTRVLLGFFCRGKESVLLPDLGRICAVCSGKYAVHVHRVPDMGRMQGVPDLGRVCAVCGGVWRCRCLRAAR
eukprot:2975501-Rhodomonas_salina.5